MFKKYFVSLLIIAFALYLAISGYMRVTEDTDRSDAYYSNTALMNTEYHVSGYDTVTYWWDYFWTVTDEYSWQIRTCYTIIVLSIFCLIALFIMFGLRIRKRKKRKKEYDKIVDRFQDKFRDILNEYETLTHEQLEERCGCTEEEFKKLPTHHIHRLVVAMREELQEVIFVPNIEGLCKLTGVRQRIEFNLLHQKEEFSSLQAITILQLPISEGILANFVNHRDLDLRNLARMSYMLSTEVEPYRYLLDFARDTAEENDWAPWYPMAIHQLFGWLVSKERPMPNFISLIEQTDSSSVAAFFIQEISYWGSFEEQQYLNHYFTSEKYPVRSAAFKSVAMLCDSEQEDAMIESYQLQPELLRREILNAVYAIKSGNQVDFFANVFHTSPSKETRELALTCLYDYSPQSRNVFEDLRNNVIETQRGLFDQIDSLQLLNTLRKLQG